MFENDTEESGHVLESSPLKWFFFVVNFCSISLPFLYNYLLTKSFQPWWLHEVFVTMGYIFLVGLCFSFLVNLYYSIKKVWLLPSAIIIGLLLNIFVHSTEVCVTNANVPKLKSTEVKEVKGWPWKTVACQNGDDLVFITY
jgi:hypothetical protein